MRNLLALCVFTGLAAAAFLGLPQLIVEGFQQTQHQPPIAQITVQSGNIWIAGEKIYGTESVSLGAQITSSKGAKAELELDSMVFQLESPNAFFKKYKDQVYLILNQGSYIYISGNNSDFKIFKNSKTYAANINLEPSIPNYQPIIKDAITHAPLIVAKSFNDPPIQVETASNPPAIKTKALNSEPDNAFLDQIIAGQSEKLQNCQVNRIRDLGTVKGQVIIGLEIHPNGSIKNAKILSTDIEDSELMNCLLSVFERIKLPKYKGEVIYRSYPLLFE